MNIRKINNNHWEIKNKKTKISFNENIFIGDFKIPGNGEYEIEGVEAEVLDGISILNIDELSIVIIDKNKKIFSEEELKKISENDILFIPVEGENTLSTKEALKIIADVEPKIIIPTYYSNIDELTKSEGIKIVNTKDFKVDKNSLESEEKQFVIFD